MEKALSEELEDNTPYNSEENKDSKTELDSLADAISDIENQILGHVEEQTELLNKRAELVDKKGNVADQHEDALLAARLKVLEEEVKRKENRIEQLRQQRTDVSNFERALDLEDHKFETTSYLEGRKLNFDTFKQITTLGTGSIVILSGLASNVLQTAEWKLLLVLTVVFLFVSVISAIYAMRLTHILLSMSSSPHEVLGNLASGRESEQQYKEIRKLLRKRYKYTLLAVQGSFLLGIGVLLIFFMKNVFGVAAG
jgi:uncharacterized protein YoxC